MAGKALPAGYSRRYNCSFLRNFLIYACLANLRIAVQSTADHINRVFFVISTNSLFVLVRANISRIFSTDSSAFMEFVALRTIFLCWRSSSMYSSQSNNSCIYQRPFSFNFTRKGACSQFIYSCVFRVFLLLCKNNKIKTYQMLKREKNRFHLPFAFIISLQ